MDVSTTSPKLTIDVDLFERLVTDPLSIVSLSSTDQFVNLQKQSEELVKRLLPSLDLSKYTPPKPDPSIESSYAFRNHQTRTIESLPKTVDDFKNVFPNFVPPSQTILVPPVSSLQSARPLHEDTKKELTPLEKMLDENFKEMHSTIQRALSAARGARTKVEEKLLSGPIHPYQKLIHEYLGPDFKSPSIYELPVPLSFCPTVALQKLNNITDKTFENTMSHFQHLTAGIGKIENEQEMELMQGLGHAFATLSSTDQGAMFIIDREKTAKYLEFAETVRTMPVREIVENPVQTAQRLIHRLIEILGPEEVLDDSSLLENSSTTLLENKA